MVWCWVSSAPWVDKRYTGRIHSFHYNKSVYCCVRTGTHLSRLSLHDSNDMYMTFATHVFNSMGVDAALCLLQGMDGMVKHPKTRKEQAYVIALGGTCIASTCSTVDKA